MNKFEQFNQPSPALPPTTGRQTTKTFTQILSERAELVSKLQDIDNETRRQNNDAEDIHHPRVPRYNFQEYPKMMYHADGKTTHVINDAREEQLAVQHGYSTAPHQPDWSNVPSAGVLAEEQLETDDPQMLRAIESLVARGYSRTSAREIAVVEGVEAVLSANEEELAIEPEVAGEEGTVVSADQPEVKPRNKAKRAA